MSNARKHILLVEDNEDQSMIMEARLNKWGYDCTLKKSADDALAYLQENKPDLIITDYDTNSKNTGIDVIKKAKTHNIPVIMHSNSSVKNEAISAGAKFFLEKTCDKEIIQKKIQEVIAMGGLEEPGGRTR